MTKYFWVIFLISTFFITGCVELIYFHHKPTHHVLSKNISKGDFRRLESFLADGVLVVPRLYTLSNINPKPYSHLFFIGRQGDEVLLCRAILKDSEENVISEVIYGYSVHVNQYKNSGFYISVGVNLFDTTTVNIEEILTHKTLILDIFYSNCSLSDTKEEEKKIRFNLKRRSVNEIAWST